MDLRQRSNSSLTPAMPSTNVRPRKKLLAKGHQRQGIPAIAAGVIGVVGTLLVVVAFQGGVGFSSKLRGGVERKVFETVSHEKEDLQKKFDELKQIAGGGPEEITSLREHSEYLRQYKYRMHRNIKEMARQSLVTEFGPGPYFAEILLSIDPLSNIADKAKMHNDTESLLIELAPPELMPATVLFFLRQINATVYDGCSFHRNAAHVIQAGPAPSFETLSNDNLWKKFRETGLESVPFQEYAPEFPHKQYTLGYAGRPGGPDFYISTLDNTVNHGPGGQQEYGEASEADPCFAKVVPGFEHIVTRMHKSSVQPDDYNHMEHNVVIRSIRMVSQKDAEGRIAQVKTLADMKAALGAVGKVDSEEVVEEEVVEEAVEEEGVAKAKDAVEAEE